MEDTVVTHEEARGYLRHPSDLLRMLVALFVAIAGFFLATTLNEISQSVTVEVISAAGKMSSILVVFAIVAVLSVQLLLPFVSIGFMMWLREWRRLLLGLLASAVAIALVALLEVEVLNRFADPEIVFSVPKWICGPSGSQGSVTCVEGDPVGHVYYLAGGVAFFSTLVPWLNARWRRFGWIFMTVVVVVRMLQSVSSPVEELLVVGLAYAVGAAVLLAFGSPDRRPGGVKIVESLARAGIRMETLRRAQVDARGSTPYFGETVDGDPIFIKVLTPEEGASDRMFRIFRTFRLKGVGDERPFSSLKRAVEHEAVGSLKASVDGIRTPTLLSVAEIEPNSMLMAFERIDGSSLDSVPAEDLTDEVLSGVWQQVAQLRARRTAHRDLRLANIFLGTDGAPWIIDFGFAELAATDGQLRSDVAELIVSTSIVVGPERAVRNAIDGIGGEAVADAASRIEPLALSGATRHGLKEHKGLDEDVRDEIALQTGVEGVELEDLERIKGTTVMMIVGFALATYFLIPQLAKTDFGAVLDADWRWAPVILVASTMTYVGAAWNLMGSIPDRIKTLPTILSQFAGTFINRISPVKVGGMATNVRFLQKNGVDVGVAVAGIGVSSVATGIVHMSLLLLSVVAVGRNATDFINLPSANVVLSGVVGLILLSAVLWFVPFGRSILVDRVWPVLKQSGVGLAQVAASPIHAVMLFGGAFTMIASYIAALWFSLEAFGGGLGIAGVAVVFLAAQAIGQAAPTPGGIGAVEAAMIAAMTAMGLDAATAVPTVFLYRVATFWLPILPGIFALRALRSDGAL